MSPMRDGIRITLFHEKVLQKPEYLHFFQTLNILIYCLECVLFHVCIVKTQLWFGQYENIYFSDFLSFQDNFDLFAMKQLSLTFDYEYIKKSTFHMKLLNI